MPTPRSSTRPERLRRVRWLYAAETFSGLGDGVFWVGLIAAINSESNFNTLLAFAVVARLGPRALLSLPAGTIVDRTDVRKLLIGTDVARAATMVALGIAVLGGLDIGWVLAGVLITYFIGVPWRPALSASLPSVVGESDLAHANALISTIRQTMTFAGPLVGVAIAAWSVPSAFMVNGATFALSAICVAAVRSVRWPKGTRRRRTATSLGDAPRPAGRVDGLGTLIGLSALMYFVRGAEMVLHVLVVRDLLEADPTAIGYLGGAVGLGAVVATPLARRAAADDRALMPLLLSIAITAAPTAMLAAAGSLSVAALLLLPVGAGMVLFEVITVVTIQRTTPPVILGRAFGALNAATNAGKLAGAIVMPAVVAALDAESALVLVGAVVALGGLGSVVPLRRVSQRAEQRRSELAPVVHRLAALELFRGATQSSLERLAQQIGEERMAAGSVLIREGEPADDVFVVVAGAFEVTTDGQRINLVAAGDWVGEIGLIEEVPRTATVTATEEATVWRIPGGVFLAQLAGADDTSALDSDIARRLAAGRSSRSRD